MTASIQIFTKPGCPYCTKVKTVLDDKGLPYQEIDVKASQRNADLSAYLSGVSTVPQIFIGGMHVNGSEDLLALAAADRLIPLIAEADGEIDMSKPTDEAAHAGAADYVLRNVIPEIDGSHSTVPTDQPILHLYKEFFGFWPNCFYYQYHWPEVAYRQFVYCHNVGAIGGGRKVLGAPVMSALGFATSKAQGCDYCQIHSASTGSDNAADYTKQIQAAQEGEFSDDNPFGPFEAALADLVAHASLNKVTEDDLQTVRDTHGEARFTKLPSGANIQAASMIAAAFGFLNVFNDLTGVKVEGAWAKQAETDAGLSAGRHGSSDERSQSNLDYDLPDDGPSMAHMLAHYAKDPLLEIGPARYTKHHLGITPAWIEAWPLPLRPLHARFYVGVMTDEDANEVRIAPELKHLMARVSGIAKGHDYLAAVEGWMAWNNGGQNNRSAYRVARAFDAAKGRDTGGLFDERERAALQLAWLSAQTPLTTPHRFVATAIEHYTPTELVHLCTVCAMASMVQRFAAIAKPKVEQEVHEFLESYHIPLDTLASKYPLADEREARREPV
ncbi:glutaredoxin domain-containing protein [Novosphingopyxis sp.]|uniref:glutaredoxin domain-containing protein n=1 Tax=Novosphingopyxis sp. TaxID=2709690 RepID=UPI003B5D0613